MILYHYSQLTGVSLSIHHGLRHIALRRDSYDNVGPPGRARKLYADPRYDVLCTMYIVLSRAITTVSCARSKTAAGYKKYAQICT